MNDIKAFEKVGQKLKTDHGQITINTSKYKVIKEIKVVLIHLPTVYKLRYWPGHLEGSGSGTDKKISAIQISERWNQSRREYGFALNFNFYAEVDVSCDPMFSIKDKARMPLGKKVYAEVVVQEKNHERDGKSLILNIYVFKNQIRTEREIYQLVENAPFVASESILIPRTDKYIRFEKI